MKFMFIQLFSIPWKAKIESNQALLEGYTESWIDLQISALTEKYTKAMKIGHFISI